MKVFKDLAVKGPLDALRKLVDDVTKALPSNWRPAPDRAIPLSGLGQGLAASYAFRRNNSPGEPECVLHLLLGGDRISVSNVVPEESAKTWQLTIEQYNAIVSEFARLLRPLAAAAGLQTEETPDEVEITRWITPEAAKLLRSFSGAANKTTGSGHPSDFKRWADFLVRVHRDGSQLDAGILRRWLIEHDRWPEEIAITLASEYEFARDLLKAYDAAP